MQQKRKDPVDCIVWQDARTLRANSWNPNRVFTPELQLLARSIILTGWVQPLLVNLSGLIIDGFHRWRLAQDSETLREKYGFFVPTAQLDLPDDRAMALTVRINRAKGVHSAVKMHELVASLFVEWEWTRERIAGEIGASTAEVDLLLQENVFQDLNVANIAYSKAWYPVKAENQKQADTMSVRTVSNGQVS